MNVSTGYTKWKHRDAVVGVGSSSIILPALRTHLTASITPHPSYNSDNWIAHPADLVDLAVIRLVDHIKFGEQHNTASVVLLSPNTASNQAAGKDALTCSWGPTSETAIVPSEKITCFEAPIAITERCKWSAKAYYEKNNPESTSSSDDIEVLAIPYIDFFDTDYNLCIMASTSYSPSCQGRDAGSPLIVVGTSSDGDDVSYVAGVFSGFAPTGVCKKVTTELGTGFPNYYRYTSTLKFGPWIQEVTGVLLPGQYPLETREVSPPTMRSLSPLKAECGSGKDNCVGISDSHLCWCDPECASHDDCCSDYESRCKPPDQGTGCTKNMCGLKAGNCWCDSQCATNSDCCDNYVDVCVPISGGTSSCSNRCGKLAPSGCSCHGDCLKNLDCCSDWAEECPSFALLGEDPKGYGTCRENCGKNAVTCWCDPGCVLNGDCCSNFEAYCSTDLKSCDGYCGGKAMSDCWCDVTCKLKGDCCSDYHIYCHIMLSPEVEEKLANAYLAGTRR
jgi:hypothetical protein